MIINLDALNNKGYIDINYDVIKDEKLDPRIKGLENARVEGTINLNSNSDIILDCVFKGSMLIEDSISLNEIPYPFEIKIGENIRELEENYPGCYEKDKNTLDLKQILWQNIVLEVPISFTICEDANIKGNGWELRDENKKVEEIDPRLKKLEELLKGDD